MSKNLATLCGIVAAVAMTTAVQAIPISGTITMGGEANLDNDISQSTSVTSWPLVYVVADSSDFSTISDFTLVNMNTGTWTFSPAPGVALSDLWNVGGFQFDFQSDTVSQSADFLTIIGYGTITGNNYDATPFQWELSAENPTTGGPVQITFSATTVPSGAGLPVPDGGLTMALLGLALAGVEGLRRKLIKA